LRVQPSDLAGHGANLRGPAGRRPDEPAQPVTVSVPFMPRATWNRQMNWYVPGWIVIVMVWDCPAAFTTSMVVFGTVNVCAPVTSVMVSFEPFAIVMVAGVKVSAPPTPCWRVSAPTEAAGDGEGAQP